MLIYDVLQKEKVYDIVANDLRSLGVKYRLKKSTVKNDKHHRGKSTQQKLFKTSLNCQPFDTVSLKSGAIVQVPVFVSQASTFLNKFINQEGLFRKAGSQVRQKELMSRLDNGASLGERNHAIDVANCLKTFFRDLPEPLIPYMYHDLFVHCAMLKSCHVQAILLACILLPPCHLNTLAFFMEFLQKISTYEKQNKMSVENLAKVIGPNIMPLQSATMSAIHARLEMHLIIVKILIENAQHIGVLSEHTVQALTVDNIGDPNNELDAWDVQGKVKKKKHRSGSLTRKPHLSAPNLNLRVLNGLRKIVGKPGLTDESNSNDSQHHRNSLGSICKSSKKRKHAERADLVSTRKKSSNEELEDTKKRRSVKSDLDSSGTTFSPRVEQRWSSARSVPSPQKMQKMRRYSIGPSYSHSIFQQTDISKADFQRDSNNVFVDADVSLSDDSGEQILPSKEDNNDIKKWHVRLSRSMKELQSISKHGTSCSSPDKDPYTDGISAKAADEQDEEYVTIPRSEYEDIKNRVSAIENRISQELGCIDAQRNQSLTIESINNVQTEYEKTLEEASIENTMTTDHLARRLGKELKIRRSAEHKIIRSPSARKIGILRRRSQEKVTGKRVTRTNSWHVTQRSDMYDTEPNIQQSNNLRSYQGSDVQGLNNINSCNISCHKDLSNTTQLLRKQLNNLKSPIDKVMKNSSMEDLNLVKNQVFLSAKNNLRSTVRRASSFHGNESVNKSCSNKKNFGKIEKTDCDLNVIMNTQKQNFTCEGWKESEPTWTDGNKFLKLTMQAAAMIPETGRASIAKLRAQNAGMVLAKARLFDETTKKTSYTEEAETNGKYLRVNVNLQRSPRVCSRKGSEQRKLSFNNNKQDKYRNDKLLASSSSVADRSEENLYNNEIEEQKFRRERNHCQEAPKSSYKSKNLIHGTASTRLSLHETEVEDELENICESTPSRPKDSSSKSPPSTVDDDDMSECGIRHDVNVMKTPYIKRPLTAKTPKGSRTIVRRPLVDTRRTPLKAVAQPGTPKYSNSKSILKARNINRCVY